MEILKVADAARLRGCSERYIRKLISDGKLNAVQLPNAANNRLEYGISIEDLDERSQKRYYAEQRKELGLPAEDKRTKPQSEKRPLESYTDDERRQIVTWTRILSSWEDLRNRDKRPKSEIDALFLSVMQLQHPELKISRDILYRKYTAYKNGDISGLIDKRGGGNKGQTAIKPHILDAFLYFYLDERRLPISRCYELMKEWAAEFYPDDVPSIPSERSFRRQAEKLPAAVISLMRYGEKDLADHYIPYIERMYDDLQANDVWVADNHTFDFITYCESTQKVHRMYLTAFIDAKSGVMVGWNLTEQPDSHSTMLAFRHGILRFGVPRSVYFDNGSEFLTHDIGGRGHRTRKTWNKDDIPPTILELLGVEMHNAIVRNAKAKPIERTFGTFKNHISRMIETFCGGTILERPESLKWKLKHGVIPEDDQIRTALNTLIDGDYNVSPYGGKERKYKGMTRIEVWNESIMSAKFRVAGEADLSLLLARTTRYQKIKRNGVYVEIAGEKLWYSAPDAWKYQGQEVYVRYDPANHESVRIYDKDTDEYRFTWTLSMDMEIDYITDDKDEIAAAEKKIRAVTKSIHDYAKGLTASLTAEQAIDFLTASLQRAERGLDSFEIKKPSKFEPVISDRLKENNPQIADIKEITIDYERINNNALKRKKG